MLDGFERPAFEPNSVGYSVGVFLFLAACQFVANQV